ncbi:hypothetical protein V0288_23280 [Pannus brasiliensis CCIBt3594]|uniref:Uncharacterized protein n=1 Tax=Pannus brasiliensis CCIBt3594 TaxID=1427578 RepID=A0AAW9QZT5_9CHRO
MVTTVNSNPNDRTSIEVREIQELSISLSAKNLNPALLTVDFLKYSGIVPQDWELNAQPVLNPNYSQVSFQNGISLVAQPRAITFIEMVNAPDKLELQLPSIVRLFIDKLPLAEYQSLAISPKSIVPFPAGPDAAREYITRTLLAPGPWQEFEKSPVQAGINLLYQLETCQFGLGINEAKLQLPDQRSIAAILFSGNFTYNLPEMVDRVALLKQYLDEWRTDLQAFREVVRERFLARQASVFNSTLELPAGPPGGL